MTGYAGIGENEGADGYQEFSSGTIYSLKVFTANATGSITALHASAYSNYGSNSIRLALYDTTNSTWVLVAETGTITSSSGDISGAASGSVTSGTPYLLAIQIDTGGIRINTRSTGASGTGSVSSTPQSYGAFPSTLVYGTWVGSPDALIWAEGSAPTTTKPKLLAHSRRRNAA